MVVVKKMIARRKNDLTLKCTANTYMPGTSLLQLLRCTRTLLHLVVVYGYQMWLNTSPLQLSRCVNKD